MEVWQPIVNVGLLTCAGLFGWFGRELWSAMKELKSDLAKLREELPKTYVAKDDFKDFRDELMTVLTRIETKLDGKADK